MLEKLKKLSKKLGIDPNDWIMAPIEDWEEWAKRREKKGKSKES